jgi:hypothetical protein
MGVVNKSFGSFVAMRGDGAHRTAQFPDGRGAFFASLLAFSGRRHLAFAITAGMTGWLWEV